MADTTIKLSGTYDSIEAYELLEEMRGVASDYLPLTGGEISGDLIVDGQLSADLTGNVTGNVTGTASGNLPLSGGTMTGKIVYNGSNSEKFSLGSSSATNIDFGWDFTNENGAMIGLRSNSDTNSGEFEILARNTSKTTSLLGTPNGVLAWDGNRVQTAKHYSTTVTVASNFTNYNSSYPLTAHRVGNVVQIYAILKSTTEKSDGEYTLFTLPNGYRPIDTIYQVAQGSSVNRWLLKITTGGVATIARYGTTSATSIANGAWLPFSVTFITTNAYPS